MKSGVRFAVVLTLLAPLAQAGQDSREPKLSAQAIAQIEALYRAKSERTGVETKMSFHLANAVRVRQGREAIKGVPSLRSAVVPDAKGNVIVDVKAKVTKPLIARVEALDARVIAASERYKMMRVTLPLARVPELAAFPDVKFVKPAAKAFTGRVPAPYDVSEREARVREKVAAALAAGTRAGTIVSEGDAAHRADQARQFFGVDGTGMKIGVLSDSVDFLADSQASGELDDVTVLQDIDPPGTGSGEGTAMLEIVHDLAPGAELLFASAFNGDFSFADNIRALREAGCDVIVDDVFYFAESPFQDGIIAKAVQDVTNDGAFYFSSAGNEGNINDGTGGVWEGDFKNGGAPFLALPPFLQVHDFGNGVFSNTQTGSGFADFLYWSDQAGKSKNDYDLLVFNSNLQSIVDASAESQDGDDDPIEAVNPPFPGERIVIVKFSGKTRALHLNSFRGTFGIVTEGQTHGHNSVNTQGGYGVAAVDSFNANGGAFTGGQENPVEFFSSDGRRRIFYDSTGKQFGSGNPLLKSEKAFETRKKPDIAAADGVSTSVPGFETFFGTSAAAPHAAAIAALVKQANPGVNAKKLRNFVAGSALDIESPGQDRDSGSGIVDAFSALTASGAVPRAVLRFNGATTDDNPGDADGSVEPGEAATLLVDILNAGGAGASGISATLSSTSPDVTVTQSSSAYPNLGAGSSANNTTPFGYTLSGSAQCGAVLPFRTVVSFTGGASSPKNLDFTVITGEPGTPTGTSYGGGPVAIPDDDSDGVDVPLAVSGFTGLIQDVDFSIDGSACSTTPGSATVGLDHTWVGDLTMTLTSPSGTTVALMSRPGGANNSGNNFCQTVLDDGATSSIQGISSGSAPFTGSFKPAAALAAFNGEDPNGTWTLNVADHFFLDSGSLRAFSIVITGATCN